jgi:rubrerythrin
MKLEKIMKVETLQDIVQWTRDMHEHLSECFKKASDEQEKTRAQSLLKYLSEHENSLAKALDRIEREADPQALRAGVSEYLDRTPIDPERTCVAPYEEMDVDEISAAIVDTHNQFIDLYRYLAGRADIPEARDLAEDLLAMEEQESIVLARPPQSSGGGDIGIRRQD